MKIAVIYNKKAINPADVISIFGAPNELDGALYFDPDDRHRLDASGVDSVRARFTAALTDFCARLFR